MSMSSQLVSIKPIKAVFWNCFIIIQQAEIGIICPFRRNLTKKTIRTSSSWPMTCRSMRKQGRRFLSQRNQQKRKMRLRARMKRRTCKSWAETWSQTFFGYSSRTLSRLNTTTRSSKLLPASLTRPSPSPSFTHGWTPSASTSKTTYDTTSSKSYSKQPKPSSSRKFSASSWSNSSKNMHWITA